MTDASSPSAPAITDVRPFVPARDFALSRSFYQALGWQVRHDDGNLALLENGTHRFFLQDFYVQDWAENMMLHVIVDDAAAWKAHVAGIVDGGGYPGVRVDGPKREPYGAQVTYVWDPAGVLLHFAEWIDD